jgi:tetratricopeptide (TPR) repeat protein
MGTIIRFPGGGPSRFGFERVKSTYTVAEISSQFGLSERSIRHWTREGLIPVAPGSSTHEPLFDLRALERFRRFRELRGKGMTHKQIYAELRGQLNLFPERTGQLIQLPLRLSPFEEGLLQHERGDSRTPDTYRRAIREGDYVADAYCNLGIWEFDGGRPIGAFDCFTLSLRHDPRHFESHFNLANLYLENGDIRLARLHYELAAEIEPSFPNVHFNLGLVHAMGGDLELAVAALNKYRELAPEGEASKADELLASIEKALTRNL